MPFSKVRSEKLAHAVILQIEQLILRGILRPGERLPSERELSDRMGVSRPSLREALAELHERGLLESRAGSGVYINAGLESQFSPALQRLFSTHAEAVSDFLDFRRDMEGLACERAARFGSESDLRVIGTVFEKMEAAHNREDSATEAELDVTFHMSIVEASHNVVMVHMMRSMLSLLQEGIFFNRTVMFRQHVTGPMMLDQHRAINDAIQARDPAAARAAMVTHMDYVATALADQQRADRNEAIAKQRFEHEQSR